VNRQATSIGYSAGHRLVEIVAIATVFTLLAGFAVIIGGTLQTARGWVHLVLTVLLAYVATDFLSGLVHWGGDTVGDERIPFVGPNFIRPFREHHVDPKAITRHDLIETNGNNCIVTAVPLALAFFLMPGRDKFGFFISVFVAFVSLFTVATNQFHKWAHADSPPAIARFLQRLGLILPPQHHDVHHAVPHDKHYCITVGWMNPVLNSLRFFRASEWMVARVRPAWLHIEERRRFAAQMAAATGGGGVAALPHDPSTPSTNS